MLDKLRGVLATHVQFTDDGFIFAFGGHGRATELQGNDGVLTPYQAIVDVIAAEPKLQGKPKVVVLDCCQIAMLTATVRSSSAAAVEHALKTGLGTEALVWHKLGMKVIVPPRIGQRVDSGASASLVAMTLTIAEAPDRAALLVINQAIAHEAGVPGTDVALDLTGPTHQLHQPTDMIVARSTAFGTKAWEQLGRGSIYTRRLADEIRARAAACSVEDLLKLTQGAIHNEPTPRQQVAHVDSSLGAYHLHLGPEIPG